MEPFAWSFQGQGAGARGSGILGALYHQGTGCTDVHSWWLYRWLWQGDMALHGHSLGALGKVAQINPAEPVQPVLDFWTCSIIEEYDIRRTSYEIYCNLGSMKSITLMP